MQPIGLTTKRSRNKYATERDGELMLIHRCTGCTKIVINRIAADDSAAAILELFESTLVSSAQLNAELAPHEIVLLMAQDRDLVQKRLFGTAHADVPLPRVSWME